MKRIIAICVLILTLGACKKNLTGLNDDLKHPSTVPAATLLTAAEKSLGDILSTPDYNVNVFNLLAQYWTQTTYIDESNYDLTTRRIPDVFWQSVYSRLWLTAAPYPEVYSGVLSNLNAAKEAVESEPAPDEDVKQNKLAVVDILMVYSWSALVNTYGDVPYSQALQPGIMQPEYDDAAAIYDDLLHRIDADLALVGDGNESFGAADVIYGGDMTAWRKFANSLKLKLGMMLADVDPSRAATVVQEAAIDGVLASNADNALIHFEATTPNTNQLYLQLVVSGRHDFVAANTLVDVMSHLNDPRTGTYFTDSAEAGLGNYVGGPYAENNSYSSYSHIGNVLLDPSLPYSFMDYAEIEFLLAEAEERGIAVGGSAEDHYNNAITASINYWGGSETDAADYLAQPEVAYGSAQGDWKEKIGTQKWIALYSRGLDAWTEWRRLDYPVLNPPPGMSQSDIPVRFTYPIQEQNINSANYNSAAAAIGGDATSTKLFWDKY